MSVLYKKEGRKYIPVAEYGTEALSSFPYGTSLVVCGPGLTSYRYNIAPNFAPMIAAGVYAEDAMAQAITKSSEVRPPRKPMTKEQEIAWNALSIAVGDEMAYIQYPSARDAVQAGIRAMQKEADKMLQHPAVKAAWDQFMLVYELVKKESND